MSHKDIQQVEQLPDINKLPSGSRQRFRLKVAQMADGAQVDLPVNVMIGGRPGQRLLMVAGAHGNEYEGILSSVELWQQLNPADLSGTIVMVFVANPPAFRARCRYNPADKQDMNRIFPGDQEKTITHRLAHKLFHSVLPGSDFLLSMHGWTSMGSIASYVEYPRSLPVTEKSKEAAKVFGLQFIQAFDWQPGLLVREASLAGIPSIEPEIGGANVSHPEQRFLYKRGIRNLLMFLDMLPGIPQVPFTPKEVTRSEILAPQGGIFLRYVEIGQAVKEGALLATLFNLNGEPVTNLYAPLAGIVATCNLQGVIEPGEAAAILFHY